MRHDRDRLRDIREAVEQIEAYTASGRSEFDTNELVQTWVLRHLQIIGEAARAISPEVRVRHPQRDDIDQSQTVEVESAEGGASPSVRRLRHRGDGCYRC